MELCASVVKDIPSHPVRAPQPVRPGLATMICWLLSGPDYDISTVFSNSAWHLWLAYVKSTTRQAVLRLGEAEQWRSRTVGSMASH